MNIVNPEVTLISATEYPEHVILTAYLQCRHAANEAVWSKSTVEKRFDAIFTVKPVPHLGVLEHASATFRVTGVSRAFSHQLVRHRLASYAQMSQRAVPIEKMGYIEPPSVSDCTKKSEFDETAHNIFINFIGQAQNDYLKLVRMGIPMEDARFVLPNAVETQIVITMNFREWLHFLRLRTEKAAQWEIREVANMIYKELKLIAPHVFDEKYKEYWE